MAIYRKLIFTALFLSLAGFLFVSLSPGDKLDKLASYFIQKQTGLALTLKGVQIKKWSEISFREMLLDLDPEGKRRVVSQAGMITMRPRFNFFQIEAEQIRLGMSDLDFLKSFEFGREFLEEGQLKIKRCRVVFKQVGQKQILRIAECALNGVALRGGGAFYQNQLISGDLRVELSPKFWRKLPREVLDRLQSLQEDHKAFRVVFVRNMMQLTGKNGPIFQATWR